MTTLKESTIFDNIEKDSIKILTRNVDKYMSIREIHNILHAEHNPNMSEKEDFKYRVHLILSVLPSKLDGIKLNKERTHIGFFSDDVEDVKEPEKINGQSLKDKEELPSNNSIAKFIIDNKLEQFYETKDNDGNSLLHILIRDYDRNNNDDLLRINKVIDSKINSLFIPNLNNKTPIDMISDDSLKNMFIKKNYSEIQICKEEIKNLIYDNAKINNELNNVKNSILSVYFKILFGFAVYYLFTKIF